MINIANSKYYIYELFSLQDRGYYIGYTTFEIHYKFTW
jgi:hypothetical protein